MTPYPPFNIALLRHAAIGPCFCVACNRLAWALEQGKRAMEESEKTGEKMAPARRVDQP